VLRRLHASVRAADSELPVSSVLGTAGGRPSLAVVPDL
jgi:hypothetical protein